MNGRGRRTNLLPDCMEEKHVVCGDTQARAHTYFPPRRPQSDQLQASLQQTFNISPVRGVSLGKPWQSRKLVRGLAWEHTLFSTDWA